MHSSGGLERRRASCERPTPIDQMPEIELLASLSS
jgi:hypothetical protein